MLKIISTPIYSGVENCGNASFKYARRKTVCLDLVWTNSGMHENIALIQVCALIILTLSIIVVDAENLFILRSHLEAIELKKIYGLNPLAEEFIPQERWRKMDKKSQKEVKFWTPGSVPPAFPSSPSLTTSIASTTSSNTPTMPDSHPVPHPPIIPPQLLLSYYNWLASGIASPPPPPFYNPAFANMVNRMPGMPPIPPMPPMPHYLHTQIPPRPPGGFSGTSPAFFTGQSNPGLLRPPLSPHRAPPVPNLMDLPMGLPPWSQGGHLPPVPVPPNLASNSMFPPLPPALSSNTMFPPLPAASSAMASSSSSAAGKAPSSQALVAI